MPTGADKPIIFISYAHEDEPEKPAKGEIKWLSFVTGYLQAGDLAGRGRPLDRPADVWRGGLGAGDRAEAGACDIFILLVSRHSLASDYVVRKEIAIIRERQANGEALHFYPLVVTPTPKIALDLVRDRNLRPLDGKPLSDYSLNERYRHMTT